MPMNRSQKVARHRAVDAALGSVRAEGLNPSAKVQKLLHLYADGKISAKDLRSIVISTIRIEHSKKTT